MFAKNWIIFLQSESKIREKLRLKTMNFAKFPVKLRRKWMLGNPKDRSWKLELVYPMNSAKDGEKSFISFGGMVHLWSWTLYPKMWKKSWVFREKLSENDEHQTWLKPETDWRSENFVILRENRLWNGSRMTWTVYEWLQKGLAADLP